MSAVREPQAEPPDELRSEPGSDAGDCARGTARRAVVCITSEQLFAGASEVQIEHRGALYRLQRTSLGKLILTK